MKKRDGNILQFVENNLKSTKVERQLQGLQILRQSSISIISDNILSVIIENCLSSEGNEVCAQAYRLLQYIYSHRNRSLRWSEVTPILTLELSDLENSDNKNVLAAMIGLISSLQDSELVQFFIDSGDSIKKSFYLIDPKMRYIATLGFGKLIVKVIQIFDEDDFAIEAHCHGNTKRRSDDDDMGSSGKFESLSDARRVREELFDLFRDLLVICSRVVAQEPVKVPQDNIDSKVDIELVETYQSFEACCEVIFDLFCLYNSGQNELTFWTDGLMGHRSGLKTWNQMLRNQSVKLESARLVATAIKTLLKDNFILLDRRKQFPTSIALSNLISQLVLALLQEIPVDSSSIFTAFKLITPPVSDSFFAAKKEATDETEASRINRTLLFQCLPFIHEWLTNHLLPSVLELSFPVVSGAATTGDVSKSDLLLFPKLFELLSISKHLLLHDFRIQNAPVIIKVIQELLQRNESFDVNEFPMRRELLAWGLLVCSDLPTALLTPSVATLLKFLMRENDDTVVTRYLSEALVLLLRPHTSIVWMMAQLNDFYENHMFIHLFETNWLAQLLVAPESTVNASVGQLFKHRFVASLCRILSRLLPAAVADVCRKCADIVLNELDDSELYHQRLWKSNVRLLQILSASLLTLKYCGRTLGWSVGGNYSSAASIAYSNLLLQLTLILAPLLLPSEQADGRITTALPRWATCAIPPPELELDLALDSTIDMNELRPFALQLAQEFTQVYDNYFQKLPTNDAMLHTAIPCPDSRKTVLRVLLHNIASIDTSVTKDRKETRSIQDIATKLLNILQSELFLQKTLLGSDNASGRTSQKQSPSVSITSGKSVAEDFLLQITATHPLEKQLPELVASQSSYLELLDSLYIAEKDTLLRNSYRAIFEGFKAACEGLVTPVADGIISSVQTMTEELVALYISHQLPYSLTLRQQVTIVDRSFTSLLTTDSLAVATVLQSPIFNSISRPNLLQFRYVGFDFEAHLHSVFRYLHDKSTGALTGNSGSAASYQLHSSEYLELIHSTENLKEEHAEQAEASARVLHLLVKLSSSHGYKSSSYSKSDAIRASTSDVLSIIDDALLPHLPCADKISFSVNDQFDALVHPIVTDFAPSLSHYQERRWSQLSGSADMFVVLGCVSADPLGQIVRFRLRIINSSGFKVPSFSIQVALRYNSYAPRGTLNSESETYKSYFSTSADWSSNSIEPVSLLADEPYTAPGDEYFLPGAYIEREFVYQLSDLGSFQLLPRLVFEDVEFEDSKVLFNSSEQQPNDATTSPGKVRPDVSDEEDPAIPSPVGRSKTDAVTIETVSLECEPFPVGLVHQLFPYGQYALNGNISSHPDAFPAGIPSAVFLQQWERLNTRAKDRIGVKLDDKLRSVVEASMLGLAESRLPLSEKLTLLSRRVEKFVTYSVQCAMAQSNVSPHESLARLGVAARVDLADEAHYMLLPSVSILSSFNTTGSSNDTSLLAWSLQTFRGDEIAILVSLPSRSVFSGTFTAPYSASTFVDSRLSAFSKNVGTVFDSKSPNSMKQPSVNSSTDCWMEVRCSNSHTLKVVLEDIGNMIFVLKTAGRLSVAAEKFIPKLCKQDKLDLEVSESIKWERIKFMEEFKIRLVRTNAEVSKLGRAMGHTKGIY